LNSFNPPRFDYFANFIKAWQGVHVLDVGCGGGFTSEYLAKMGAVVHGIDISPKLIETAKKHAYSMSLKIEYKQGAGESLPYEDNRFDVVICVDVLEHVSDLRKVISEIQRVLKPGGLFLFDTINKTEESKFVMIRLMEDTLKEVPKGSHKWEKFIEPETLKALLHDMRFEKIEMKGFEVKGKDEKSDALIVEINDNVSVMYIGKAILAI